MRDIYSLYLRHVGFRAETASRVDEALLKAGDERPDVMVLDLFLAGLGGPDGVRRLRRDNRLRHVRIIGLSGASAQTMHPEVAVDCDRLLPTPCTPEELVAEIKRVLQPS